MRNATLQHRPPADNVGSPGEQRHPIKHSRKIDQNVDACSILRRMTDSLQVNQEGDLETHIFSQGSQLARASSCTCTVSMATTTRSDAWPLRWALAGPGRGCLGWGEKKGRTLSTNFSPFHLSLSTCHHLISGKSLSSRKLHFKYHFSEQRPLTHGWTHFQRMEAECLNRLVC